MTTFADLEIGDRFVDPYCNETFIKSARHLAIFETDNHGREIGVYTSLVGTSSCFEDTEEVNPIH